MERATVDGFELAYEVLGVDGGEPWAITPGGRYPMDSPGVPELAEALAAAGRRVLLWDRPNVGSSGVRFIGETESDMQADALAALLRHVELGPAVLAGGSGGARVSLLTALRHPDAARGTALWWISGGVFGLVSTGNFYCGESIRVAWNGGMEAVVELPGWQEVLERNPRNRERFLALDAQEFLTTMQRWLLAYCPCGDDVVPGLPESEARALAVPALVFRNGLSDMHHTRATSDALATLLPDVEVVDPPWGDSGWVDSQHERATTGSGLFAKWPTLAPQLLDWADRRLA